MDKYYYYQTRGDDLYICMAFNKSELAMVVNESMLETLTKHYEYYKLFEIKEPLDGDSISRRIFKDNLDISLLNYIDNI